MKYFILVLMIGGSLFLLFRPLNSEIVLPNPQLQEILNLASKHDVIIIFNSGGWGDTPLRQAKDFAPVIEGIKETLQKWGYNSAVVSYTRVEDNLLGRLAAPREFHASAENLAKEVEVLNEMFPQKKVIIAGLSNGAAFVNETMARLSEECQDKNLPVYGIAAGTPFWMEKFNSANILQLDNDGRDKLSEGDKKILLASLAKGQLKWFASKIAGKPLSFARAVKIPGHSYPWNSPEINHQIVAFLKEKFSK